VAQENTDLGRKDFEKATQLYLLCTDKRHNIENSKDEVLKNQKTLFLTLYYSVEAGKKGHVAGKILANYLAIFIGPPIKMYFEFSQQEINKIQQDAYSPTVTPADKRNYGLWAAIYKKNYQPSLDSVPMIQAAKKGDLVALNFTAVNDLANEFSYVLKAARKGSLQATINCNTFYQKYSKQRASLLNERDYQISKMKLLLKSFEFILCSNDLPFEVIKIIVDQLSNGHADDLIETYKKPDAFQLAASMSNFLKSINQPVPPTPQPVPPSEENKSIFEKCVVS